MWRRRENCRLLLGGGGYRRPRSRPRRHLLREAPPQLRRRRQALVESLVEPSGVGGGGPFFLHEHRRARRPRCLPTPRCRQLGGARRPRQLRVPSGTGFARVAAGAAGAAALERHRRASAHVRCAVHRRRLRFRVFGTFAQRVQRRVPVARARPSRRSPGGDVAAASERTRVGVGGRGGGRRVGAGHRPSEGIEQLETDRRGAPAPSYRGTVVR